MKKQYKLTFSNSNNVWYTLDSFYGKEVDMLKYADEKLNNKENKLYNLWIYDDKNKRLYMDFTLAGCFRRGKKIEKLIKHIQGLDKKERWNEIFQRIKFLKKFEKHL